MNTKLAKMSTFDLHVAWLTADIHTQEGCDLQGAISKELHARPMMELSEIPTRSQARLIVAKRHAEAARDELIKLIDAGYMPLHTNLIDQTVKDSCNDLHDFITMIEFELHEIDCARSASEFAAILAR